MAIASNYTMICSIYTVALGCLVTIGGKTREQCGHMHAHTNFYAGVSRIWRQREMAKGVELR